MHVNWVLLKWLFVEGTINLNEKLIGLFKQTNRFVKCSVYLRSLKMVRKHNLENSQKIEVI